MLGHNYICALGFKQLWNEFVPLFLVHKERMSAREMSAELLPDRGAGGHLLFTGPPAKTPEISGGPVLNLRPDIYHLNFVYPKM